MTAVTVEPVSDLACGACGALTDECMTLRDDCCSACTHYPNPVDNDVDEVAVDRAVKGDTSVPLNRAEYAEAHRILHGKGKSAHQIAVLLGTSERQVQRWNGGYTHPISRRPGGRAMSTTEELIATAAQHPSKRVQVAARRAQDAVRKVRDLLAEDAGKAEQRQRVARLERELREAKAALRPQRSASVSKIDTKAVREWAVANGVECPARGVVPKSVVAAYEASEAVAS